MSRNYTDADKYNMRQQDKETADAMNRPAAPILPGLPGGPPLLPVDRLVPEGQEGELVIFDDDDVRQALRQLVTSSKGAIAVRGEKAMDFDPKAYEAMRHVMMFSLSIAALNVGVAPNRPVVEERLVETEILPPDPQP